MLFNLLKKINKFLPENLRLLILPYYRFFFKRFNNIIFLPQLACNYNCKYCLWNRFSPPEFKSVYYSYKDWIEVFSKFSPSIFTITGGEPLLYKDIDLLIDNFPSFHIISSLVSNLSVNLEKLINLKNKNFRIMASFHPDMVKKETFFKNILLLKKAGFRNITVNFVAYPSYLKEIPQLKNFFEKEKGIFFRVDTFKDPNYNYTQEEVSLVRYYKRKKIIAKDRTEGYNFEDFSPKICSAGKNYFIIISNGNVYSCMEGYYYSECSPFKDKKNKIDNFYMGNLFLKDFRPYLKNRICYSCCAELCDIELAGVRRIR
ncbi:MAG: hypothetical protein QXZ20_04710 [Candidatus Aenigmatarchaeota archaeon]